MLFYYSYSTKNVNIFVVFLAIDVWMAVCLGFVFLGLVEFAYVNVLSRVEKRRKKSTIGSIAVGTMMAGVAAKNAVHASPGGSENKESEDFKVSPNVKVCNS
jgi:cytochrome bd-type quinol oxidase subunit 1